MNYTQVQGQLTDLPDTTFLRFGPIFAGIITSLTAALTRSTASIDQLANNINPNFAKYGWLTAIGQLYGILRNPYETDPQYRTRLIGTLSSTRGTPLSITRFLSLALNLNAPVTENFTTYSYQIVFLTPVSQQTLQNVVVAINWVRPAGVPFLPFYIVTGGLFLNTVNYFGTKKVTGSYLSKPSASVTVNLAAFTNNPVSTLPTPLIVDPYVTGTAQVNFAL